MILIEHSMGHMGYVFFGSMFYFAIGKHFYFKLMEYAENPRKSRLFYEINIL